MAYLAIPAVLIYFVWRRSVPFSWMFLMFGAFIISCGFTHFMEVLTFYDPLYRLSGFVKLITALASWATVLGLIPLIPRALAMRTPEELEREIAEREKAERSLQQAHAQLELRVQERTAELATANEALQAEIVERRRAQEEREELLVREQTARAEAEAANRIKDEFLATLSHELRTPLNAMLGWVHLLRSGKLDPATMSRGIETLERNTRAQAQLINDLLDVSRITMGKIRLETRKVELGPIIEAAVDSIRPAAEAKGIQLGMTLDPLAGPILGDATRLQQVVWNLLANAVKFTPRRGRVEVQLVHAGTHAAIIIQDTGEGIRPDFLPQLFERLRQADSSSTRVHGGLGLGLAIVRHLVELHGGTVQAESEGKGKGATFTVRLPIMAVRMDWPPGTHRMPQRIDNLEDVPSVAGLKVLVVDDEADARELLSVVLAQRGVEVTAVGSVQEALEVLDHARPDVLLSDIGMPGQDGYALIRAIRALDSDHGGSIPAVALTAYARPEDRARVLASGFQIHVPKPVDPRELIAVVASLATWKSRS